MWRSALSVVAIVADALWLGILAMAVAGQAMLADGAAAAAPETAPKATMSAAALNMTYVVEGLLVATLAVNILAVLFGARRFPPRAASTDLVSNFD